MRTTENRGVPGSSPGLAIAGSRSRMVLDFLVAGVGDGRLQGSCRPVACSGHRIRLMAWTFGTRTGSTTRPCPNACPNQRAAPALDARGTDRHVTRPARAQARGVRPRSCSSAACSSRASAWQARSRHSPPRSPRPMPTTRSPGSPTAAPSAPAGRWGSPSCSVSPSSRSCLRLRRCDEPRLDRVGLVLRAAAITLAMACARG